MNLKVFTKSKISDLLHDQNIQISANTIIELDSFVERLIIGAVEKIKLDTSVKRISGEMLVAYVFNNLKSKTESKPCQKCAGIKDVFLKAARDLQTMVIDEAKIALTKLERGETYVK